ncbi:unnamed protein product [Symbiodinium sp. CCMP2456]|nr:unnamed protein product [Symbiodinium sp. CCMP2456]
MPNLHMEFEESVFALARALQVPTGRPLIQVCDEFEFKVPTFAECDRLVKKIKGWYNTSMPAKLPGEPKGGNQDGSTDAKTHVRSPELFDELVLADGKKEAWAPRANKITGQWFDQIKNLKDVSANLMFLKSEDLADALTATFARMGSFFGVNASLFPYEVTDGTSRIAQMPLYQISGWRPMLCSTRRFIYSKTRDVCEELDSFGVHYSSCLGEKDDCVDPAPGSSKMPMPGSFPYLPSLPLKESAPSNLVVVGGFRTCGTRRIYDMLESHPNIVTLSIQVGAIPNLQLEFEEVVFALAKALQVPTGRQLIQTCDQYKPHQAQTFKECDRLVNKIRGSYNTSMPATLVVTDPSFFDKGMLASRWPGKVKLLFVVREPADFLWAAYNIWVLPGEPKGQDGKTGAKIHVRSPELFNELVLADGKKEAWAPRANKITGQWFDQIKNLKDVSANLMFLKSEDLAKTLSATLARMGSFFGVDAALFSYEVTDGYINSLAARVARTPLYQISGYRPMLCRTRRFIYSKTRDVCEDLDSFGVHYSACLGEHDDCVDPRKEANSSAPSNLVVVGGFRTCGTQRIYDMLKSHPNIVTLPIQVGALPNLELEFEEVVFALAKALQVPNGRRLMQVCDEFQLKVPTFVECDRLVNKIKGSYDTSMPATLVVTDPSFFDKGMLAARWPGKVKLLFVVREPADFLWAAYNNWALPGEPKGNSQDGRTKMKTHVRSPERFNELVLADGKKEAWAPRANKITGQWFNQIKNLKDVSANLLFLKFEDLAGNLTDTLPRMGSFFGVNASLFPSEVTDGYIKSLASLLARTPLSQISGYRPMLCRTRRFIYSKTRDVCEELDSFGVHYSACLGEHDECVDPTKEASSSPPSNLVVIGGFRTCGTQRIYDMLKSHPNIVTLSIQVGALPKLELEFEEVVFALAKALQVPTGRRLIQVCDEFQFKVPTFIECGRLVNKIRGSYNTSMPATLVVTDPSFFDKGILATRWPGKVKLLVVVRDPADFLWAAYNTWALPGEPNGNSQAGGTKMKIHVRSPERFNELVLADGKKEAWAPRANKITGQWFNQIKNLKDVSRNLLFLKFEGFSQNSAGNLGEMGSFFGVDPSLFHNEVADVNTTWNASVPRTPMYQISGWRPMLCSTRRFIYSKTRDVCEELDSIGIHYNACLGEHDDCVDPPPGSSFPPRPAPRPRPFMPGRFRLRQKAFANGLPTLVFNGTAPNVKQGVAAMVENSPSAAEIPIFVVGLTFGGIIARMMKGR